MQIAEHYIRSDFIYDLIPLIPLPLILELDDGRQSHFYIIKCMRVVNGFRVFDVNVIMQEIRKFNQRRLQNIIDHDPILAENKLLNQNQISEQIVIKFFLKIVKLGLIIFHICYFLGQIWFIFAYVNMRDWHIKEKKMSDEEYSQANHDSFIEFY